MRPSPVLACIAAILSAAGAVAAQTPTLNDVQALIGSPSVDGDFAGSAIAISGSGNTVAVGAPRWGSPIYWPAAEGALYVFERNQATGLLEQQARLTLSGLGFIAQPEDHFGWSVAISEDGNRLVVGAPAKRINNYTFGDAYVIERVDGAWRFVQRLNSWDHGFGASVAMRGSTIVVGATGAGGIPAAGAAFVYRREPSGWARTAELTPDDGWLGDDFGAAVAIDEDENTVVVGAPSDSEPGDACSTANAFYGCERGSAYAFEFNAALGQWQQRAKLTASAWPPTGPQGHAAFGQAVSISGSTIVVGAPGDKYMNTANGGAAYIFRTGSWSLSTVLIPSTTALGDRFGSSVAVWGPNILVGAPRTDEACPPNIFGGCDSGSVYWFQLPYRSLSWVERARLVARDAAQGRTLGWSVSLIGTNIAVGAASTGSNLVGSEGPGRAYVFSLGAGPDLVTTFVSDPPAALQIDETFSATDTVENRGRVNSALTTTTRYYLSPDGSKHGMDGFLNASRRVGILAPDASSTGGPSAVPRVPSIKPGSYYLMACADDTQANVESDESNNCAISANTVMVSGADLVVTSVSNPPTSALLGSTFAVTETTANQGNAITSRTTVTHYFLSADRFKDVSDTRFASSRAVDYLSPAEMSTGTVTLTVPAAAAGTYFLLACADGTSQVREADETNNCRSSNGTIRLAGPDLETTVVGNPPVSATIGGTIVVSDTVRNNGTVAAAASTSRYYLSADAVYGSGDFRLTGSRAVPALSSFGGSSAGSMSVGLPSMPPGPYYLIACADDLVAVPETNEANNCRASVGVISVSGPDLITTAISNPPTDALIGSSFAVYDAVSNQGTSGAGAFAMRFYLSFNATKGVGDVLLEGGRSIIGLDAGASSSDITSVAVPPMAAGSYLLLACADDPSTVVESVETNNCAASSTTVVISGPDLVVSSVNNPPPGALRGGSFFVSDTVSNQGNETAGVSVVRYYLSVNGSFDATDRSIASRAIINALTPGGLSSGSAAAVVPATIAPGLYYLIACADDTDIVFETSETNNCRTAAARIAVQ